MPTLDETLVKIATAASLDERVAEIRRIPQHHGTAEHLQIFAEVARTLYVPHLTPDFAYVHGDDFYGQAHFESAYEAAYNATSGFTRVSEDDLSQAILQNPKTLLVFRTITGLAKAEFGAATSLVAMQMNMTPITSAKVDSMERKGTPTSPSQAAVVARTIHKIVEQSLFAAPPKGTHLKQDKPDTKYAWASIQQFAAQGMPFSLYLHQRHYGGAFRQLLDATSKKRGDVMEDVVEDLFRTHGIPYVRTSAGNHSAVGARFQLTVKPAPDFIIHDQSNTLRAILECKQANDGGTARDKAARFASLRGECNRLGGIALVAVLSGIGWTRVRDTLGPVVRDTEGRVFTPSNLASLLAVAPFPALIGLAP